MLKKTLKKPIVLTLGKKKHKIKSIEFASDKRVRKHEKLAYEFVRKIFGVKGALLSDMSSVYDFDFTFDFEKDTIHHDTAKVLKK
jgi:hypothetical protein